MHQLRHRKVGQQTPKRALTSPNKAAGSQHASSLRLAPGSQEWPPGPWTSAQRAVVGPLTGDRRTGRKHEWPGGSVPTPGAPKEGCEQMVRGVPGSARRRLQTAPEEQVRTRSEGTALRAPGPSVRCRGLETRRPRHEDRALRQKRLQQGGLHPSLQHKKSQRRDARGPCPGWPLGPGRDTGGGSLWRQSRHCTPSASPAQCAGQGGAEGLE